MPYSVIRSGLWQELSIFHLCLVQKAAVWGCTSQSQLQYQSPQALMLPLFFTLLDSLHETCHSLGYDASSIAWAEFFVFGTFSRDLDSGA